MIRMTPVQNGRKLEVTINRDDLAEQQALDAVTSILVKSRHAAHQALLRQIERQCETSLTIVRFTLDAFAAGRIAYALQRSFELRRSYPDRGTRDLHTALGRMIQVRTETARA